MAYEPLSAFNTKNEVLSKKICALKKLIRKSNVNFDNINKNENLEEQYNSRLEDKHKENQEKIEDIYEELESLQDLIVKASTGARQIAVSAYTQLKPIHKNHDPIVLGISLMLSLTVQAVLYVYAITKWKKGESKPPNEFAVIIASLAGLSIFFALHNFLVGPSNVHYFYVSLLHIINIAGISFIALIYYYWDDIKDKDKAPGWFWGYFGFIIFIMLFIIFHKIYVHSTTGEERTYGEDTNKLEKIFENIECDDDDKNFIFSRNEKKTQGQAPLITGNRDEIFEGFPSSTPENESQSSSPLKTYNATNIRTRCPDKFAKTNCRSLNCGSSEYISSEADNSTFEGKFKELQNQHNKLQQQVEEATALKTIIDQNKKLKDKLDDLSKGGAAEPETEGGPGGDPPAEESDTSSPYKMHGRRYNPLRKTRDAYQDSDYNLLKKYGLE